MAKKKIQVSITDSEKPKKIGRVRLENGKYFTKDGEAFITLLKAENHAKEIEIKEAFDNGFEAETQEITN
jgi:hypothetical protein